MSAFESLESQLLQRIAERDEVEGRESPRGDSPRSPRGRGRWTLGVATAGLAATALLLASLLPGGRPSPAGLLSPEQAVAAASDNLESEGVLEWVDFQGVGALRGRKQVGTQISRWTDLKTGDRREVQTSIYGPTERAVVSTWSIGRTTWLDEGEVSKSDGRRIVRKRVSRQPPGPPEDSLTPVMQLRRDLQRAAEGKLAIQDAGVIDNVPAVLIVDVQEFFTKRTWISRESSPRVLRTEITTVCMRKLEGRCRPDMPRTVYAPSVVESRTLRWKIHPRTSEALEKTRVPSFDRKKYEVISG